ncbi:hypothetical protein DL96DRAFT_1744226 [Flagelloscypha sp. PMI_526]|nr:hypothetical protein DL96DRAFT_1744226 [Flagelloscypha sp. PMI_526]
MSRYAWSHTADNAEEGRSLRSLTYSDRRCRFNSMSRASLELEQPAIPTILHGRIDHDTTPLPILSMTVLSIAMLGEFLSANVSGPFMLFMVADFEESQDNSRIALLTGFLASSFFLCQFLSSLLWSSINTRCGTPFVLRMSLFGSFVTCLLFGLSRSFSDALVLRMLQGIFSGSIGVVRSAVSQVTDTTNEARAYSILGFCWGLGGIFGAIIGGTLDHPSTKWPNIFGQRAFFVENPYALPCGVAASVILAGKCAVLSVFLRSAEENATTRLEKGGQILSSATVAVDQVIQPASSGPSIRFQSSGFFQQSVHNSTRLFPRSDSLMSNNTNCANYGTFNHPRGLAESNNVDRLRRSESHAQSLAQLFVMAHQSSVQNLSDLWVAAAINADECDSETVEQLDELPFSICAVRYEGEERHETETSGPSLMRGRVAAPPDTHHQLPESTPYNVQRTSLPLARFSTISTINSRFSGAPSIFSNTGIETVIPPHSYIFPQDLPPGPKHIWDLSPVSTWTPTLEQPDFLSLVPIPEGGPQTRFDYDYDSFEEDEGGIFKDLPGAVIVQYGLLAFHSTALDQLFMSHLISDSSSGGLDLTSGNFAFIIAVISFAQVIYQFYLYPHIGPPRGQLSHLMMLRIALAVFVLAYLSVVPLRWLFLGNETILMIGLVLTTALRYCASTFAYTALAVLLSYMSPPHLTSQANAVAQSTMSLARCIGLIFGGWLWSYSTLTGWAGYPFGFFVVAWVAAVAFAQSFEIL